MKIAHFSNEILPVNYYGVVERVIVWLLEGLQRMGHKNYLLAPHGTHCPYAEVIPVQKVKKIEVESPTLDGKIPADANVLHYHYGYSYFDYKLPTLKTIHGYAWLDKQLDGTFNFLSDAHRRAYKRPDLPFVHNGLKPEEYLYRENKEDFLLFLSRADWKVKGLPVAIEVARRTGMKIIIAGNAHRKFVEGYAGFGYLKRHFGKNCLYVGEVGGQIKAAYLAKAKAMIFPTQWEEPFGLVAIEAMVSGTPVITTHHGAMPEIVVDKKTGFLCDSVEDMVNAVRRINDISPMDCRKRVLEHFHYMRMAEDYIKLYIKQINDYTKHL
jgi:glycosyltransferase involved in cell wall biosynthesis